MRPEPTAVSADVRAVILPFKSKIIALFEDRLGPDFKELSLVTEIVERVGPLVHDKDYHFFCDEDLGPVVSFLIIIFSVPREQQAIEWYCDKFAPILSRCQNCVQIFMDFKNKIIQRYIAEKGVAYSNIESFDLMICKWRSKMIHEQLKNVDGAKLNDTQRVAFLECFWYPRVLKQSPTLKAIFNGIFEQLQKINSPILDYNLQYGISKLNSGTVFLLMEGTQEQQSWVLGNLNRLFEEEFIITPENLSLGFLQEINVHYIYLISRQFGKDQAPTPLALNSMAIAWNRLTAILSLMQKEVLTEHFIQPKFTKSLENSGTRDIPSLIHLWYNWFSVPDSSRPLDVMLKVLNLFLEKFGSDFWDYLKPCNFNAILDLTFAQGTFANTLLRKQDSPILKDGKETWLSINGSVSDLISWSIPFYNSLSSVKKIQMVKKLSTGFLMTICECNDMLKALPKLLLMSYSLKLLNNVLEIDEKKRSMLYTDSDLQNQLLTMADCRKVVNNQKIMELLSNTIQFPSRVFPGMGTEGISLSTISLICHCIEYDVLNLCETTYKLYSGKILHKHGAIDLGVQNSFLSSLISKLDFNSLGEIGPKYASYLMSSFKNVNGLMILNVKGNKNGEQNDMVSIYIHFIRNLLSKCSELPAKHLLNVLSQEPPSQGLWSCLFSCDKDLYQEATNILYEVFNVEGRLEGLQELFKQSLSISLHCITIVLAQLTKTKFFEPCPRAVRVVMDVLTIFTEPVTGIFSNYVNLKDSESDEKLLNFWGTCWKFLDMIYLETIQWTTKHSNNILENFTRDVLELSNMLMNSYRDFSDILIIGDSNKDDLFKYPMSPFKNMLYWLRLNDEQLLASCVQLIVSASDLAKEKDFKFDELLVLDMAKYASKARKYPNKLSSNQSQDLLDRARYFNEPLTEQVLKESEHYHLEKKLLKKGSEATKATTPSTLPSIVSKAGSPNDVISPSQRADLLLKKASAGSSLLSRPKGQATLSSYGFFKSGGAPTFNNPPPKPLSRFELERKKLLEKRVVHPAQSQVFNTKPAKGPRRADSSSEDESDFENAAELFAVAKSKSRTYSPGMLDINGREIRKPKSVVDINKIEEENMRKRLNIDLAPFYEKILKWEYTRDSPYPSDDKNSYTDVQDVFKSATAYQEVMEPLLLLECWQGLCSARDREEQKTFSFVVGNRTAVSDFYEVYAAINKDVARETGITDSDLLVLAIFPNQSYTKRLSDKDFKKSNITCLAKIKELKNSKGENMDLTFRIHRSHKFANFLTLRSEIHALKVMQMTTVEREYASLKGLPYYHLLKQIIDAKPTVQQDIDENEINRVKRDFKLNTSQAKAIVATVSTPGFSLIQGPPGTGKTKTILGIVGYFISKSNNQSTSLISHTIVAPSNSASTEQLLQRQKVLICAPSNAAVDELVIRLREGVLNSQGTLFHPAIVRIGRSDAVNDAIKDLTLEEKVDKKISGTAYEMAHDSSLDQKFQGALRERKQLTDTLNRENMNPNSSLSSSEIAEIQLKLRELRKQIGEMGRRKDEIRESNSVKYRNREIDRRKAQARILAESDVICSTLSGSAHDVLASLGVTFDTVIIDEACQCTELSSIIPLRYGGKRCIMVGDPNQLPPTVLSGAASDMKYNQSLFVRMQKNSSPHLLDVQYRMHPGISKFPSLEFYKGKLHDGPSVLETNKRIWHSEKPFSPYKFFDIVAGQQMQNQKTMSFTNPEETRVAIELVEVLLSKFENKYDFSKKIGIISPYREQMQAMRAQFRRFFGDQIRSYIDFNTIDGFQGQEKEIIIISCVRADDTTTSVGFLKDFRRMNVALTRAKCSLWILGHHKSLINNNLWRHLISDAKERGCLDMACSGFLNPQNKSAQKMLEKYKGSHDYITNEDTYDPLAYTGNAYSKKSTNISKRGKNDDLSNPSRRLKQQKTDVYRNPTSGVSRRKGPEETKSKASPTTGTKKKSSIFGGSASAEPLPDIKPFVPTIVGEKNSIPLKKKLAERNALKFDPSSQNTK